jgi:flagellar hook-associated protein 1 FlgK
MEANHFALTIASHNISNSSTSGYSRQRVIMQPSEVQGVEVTDAQALRNGLIENRLREETSARSKDETLDRVLSDLEVLFTDTEDQGLLLSVTQFFNSFHDLSVDPASVNAREQVRLKAVTMAESFRSRGENLRNAQTLVNRSVLTDVAEINRLAAQIANLTGQINEQEIESPANALRDQRSALVRQLAEIANVKEFESGREYQLSIGSNRLLVLNNLAMSLSTDPAPVTGFYNVYSGASDISHEITGGRLSAAFALRDQYTSSYLNSLDQLAYEIIQEVNAVHSTAYDLDGTTGTNFFAPLGGASGASRSMQLSAVVSANPRRIAAAQQPAGLDNNGALAIGNLLHSAVFTGGSVTDQYRSLVFNVGSDALNAETGLREHEALASQLENRRQALSGVSIDEETVQILQFQRSYEASARLVSAVDELLQVALGMGR